VNDTDKIKERLNIVDVVAGYVELEKSGANFRARCPFHNEKTPSFYVSSDRQYYNCFGCGAKGDVFNFIQNIEGIEFYDALQMLADKAGVALSKQSNLTPKTNELYEVMRVSAEFFRSNLVKDSAAEKFLRGRGVTKETSKRFNLGLAPSEWRILRNYLRSRGFKDQVLEQAGMIAHSEKSKEPYDRFRERLMFPIADSAGRVIAFSGRYLGKESDTPKYLNSPDTPLFDKSATLYGFDRAKQAIRKNNFSIFVEGQFDLVLAHQAGYLNTVASSGTSVTQTHLERVAHLSPNIVLAFDSDAAGQTSVQKTARLALALGMQVKVAELPAGQDPADVIATNVEEWRRAVRSAQYVINATLAGIMKNSNEHQFAQVFKEKLLPLVAVVPSAIERASFISSIARDSGISESALMEDLAKVRQTIPEVTYAKQPQVAVKQSEISRQERIDRRLLAILIWQKSLPTAHIDMVALKTVCDEIDADTLGDITSLVIELEHLYADTSLSQTEVDELVRAHQEGMIRRELNLVRRRLREAEAVGDTEAATRCLEEYKKLTDRLHTATN
jgi:DNA primase